MLGDERTRLRKNNAQAQLGMQVEAIVKSPFLFSFTSRNLLLIMGRFDSWHMSGRRLLPVSPHGIGCSNRDESRRA
jgi:hypothetical protein